MERCKAQFLLNLGAPYQPFSEHPTSITGTGVVSLQLLDGESSTQSSTSHRLDLIWNFLWY